jgi:hypothetical protein
MNMLVESAKQAAKSGTHLIELNEKSVMAMW